MGENMYLLRFMKVTTDHITLPAWAIVFVSSIVTPYCLL